MSLQGFYMDDALALQIAAAGQWLVNENGLWVSSDDAQVQAILNAYTVADAIAYKTGQVLSLAYAKFNAIVGQTSPAEMAGWYMLKAEVAAYAASGNVTSCPNVQNEATIRGITVDALVAIINSKASSLDSLRAGVAGISGKHRDALAALTTLEEVAAYDYTTGWPL